MVATQQSSRSNFRKKDSIGLQQQYTRQGSATPGRKGNRDASFSQYPDYSPRFLDDTKFHKQPIDPSLFKIKVQRKHLEHLMNDDLDEISKFEVIYKILKD